MPLQGGTDEPKEIRSGCFSDLRPDPLWNTNRCEKLSPKRDQKGDCEMRLLFAVVALGAKLVDAALRRPGVLGP